MYVLGVPYTLKIGDYKKAGIIGKEFVLPVNQAKDVEKSLKRWYIEVAKIHLSKVLENELKGEKVTLKLTSARGKWGSMDSKGVLRLNFRLIACPNYAIRYVCCHELCHLRQMNHSQNFYKLLDERSTSWLQTSPIQWCWQSLKTCHSPRDASALLKASPTLFLCLIIAILPISLKNMVY